MKKSQNSGPGDVNSKNIESEDRKQQNDSQAERITCAKL